MMDMPEGSPKPKPLQDVDARAKKKEAMVAMDLNEKLHSRRKLNLTELIALQPEIFPAKNGPVAEKLSNCL